MRNRFSAPGHNAPSRSTDSRRRGRLFLVAALVVALAAVGLTSCNRATSGSDSGDKNELRLGYFANLTHAVPVMGVADGSIQKALGETKLTTEIFNAGPAAVEALLSDAIDAAYVGPNPAINAFVKTHGEAVRLVAGGASGGASLVVNDKISSVADLKGKTIADPQLGGTQDIALRSFLTDHGLKTDTTGGDDVTVVAQENAQTLDLFKQEQVDGAWLPEPWASRLVLEGGAKVLVDEKTLWPGGKFVTTNLLVSTKYLDEHPDAIEALLKAHVATVDKIHADPSAAKKTINDELNKLTGKPLSAAVIDRAFANLDVTWDPLAASMQTLAEHAVKAGTATEVADIHGLYDLKLLNKILTADGKPEVSAAGLDAK
jgi:sulfonate transport system substrate-binding protein